MFLTQDAVDRELLLEIISSHGLAIQMGGV